MVVVMVNVTVQLKKIKARGKEYRQYYITLPKQIVEALNIKEKDKLKVFVERGDIILRRI